MGISKKKFKESQASIGITWIDSKIVFKDVPDEKRMWLGVCHMSFGIMSFSPYDYMKLTTAVTTVVVDPVADYCEYAHKCVNFKCPLNRFDKSLFLLQYDETSSFSMSLPNDFGKKVLWFNDGKYLSFWGKLVQYFGTQPEGGLLEFSQDAYDNAQKVK